jgi:hypothetical protein
MRPTVLCKIYVVVGVLRTLISNDAPNIAKTNFLTNFVKGFKELTRIAFSTRVNNPSKMEMKK